MPIMPGDWVKSICDIDGIVKQGLLGIVCHFSSGVVGVSWDGLTMGHNCNDHCPEGRGYYVRGGNLQKVDL